MLFSTLLFLFGFLPLFLAAYFASPQGWRNGVLIGAGLFFYAWGEPVFVGILFVASVLVWWISLQIDPKRPRSSRARILWFGSGLTLALGLLVVCKYANFAVAQFNALRGMLGHSPLPWAEIALPIGVSFFTFQKISYLLDVRRGVTPPARTLGDFLVYVFLFPQLIAGPIIRYHEISDQIAVRPTRVDDFLEGSWRFCVGLSRKVLLANPLGLVADTIFGLNTAELPLAQAWVGLLCYTFQIYCDFAGYSDMAIGLARMMGFRFPENFDRPYASRSITEFWRRWHITLGAFMREYLYVPLGGNRGGLLRTSFNLWFVFLASGFWHGAGWTFIAWGAWHGLLLTVERLSGVGRGTGRSLLWWPSTFLLASLGWVVFRAANLTQAWSYVRALFDFSKLGFIPDKFELLWPELVSTRALCALVLAVLFALLPMALWERLGLASTRDCATGQGWRRLCCGALLLVLTIAALSGQNFNPFIYTRF